MIDLILGVLFVIAIGTLIYWGVKVVKWLF